MKDAKGHGSNPKGGASLTPVQQENQPFKSRLSPAAGHSFLDPQDPRGAHSAGVQEATAPMQRRQFEAIAGAINSFGQGHPDVHADLASHFASALRGTNSKFQADKFRTAAMTGSMGRTQGKAPGMTRGHYEAVAGMVRSFGNSHPGVAHDLAQHFANRLGSSNANFKADRFMKKATS